MSQMRVPVTDAFDETDQLQSLEVELTPRQIEWLEHRAEERGLSLDHVLRSVITAQIRGTDEPSTSSSPPGDGVPESTGSDASPSVRVPTSTADEEDPPSIVESLRAASERLQDLTDKETASSTEDTSDLRDTIARFQNRLETSTDEETAPEGTSSEDAPSDDGGIQDPGRSMFDMVEE